MRTRQRFTGLMKYYHQVEFLCHSLWGAEEHLTRSSGIFPWVQCWYTFECIFPFSRDFIFSSIVVCVNITYNIIFVKLLILFYWGFFWPTSSVFCNSYCVFIYILCKPLLLQHCNFSSGMNNVPIFYTKPLNFRERGCFTPLHTFSGISKISLKAMLDFRYWHV